MRIKVAVRPNADRETVNRIKDSGEFSVTVNKPPKSGRANRAVIDALARYFNVAKSRVKIIKGERSRKKIVDIL